MDNNNSNYSNFQNNSNNGMLMKEPEYDQFIIKPPDKNITHKRKPKRFIIDSRFRDFNLFDNPGKYVYPIPQYFRDVVSAELIEAKIPNTFYNIYEGNNKLYYMSVDNNTKIDLSDINTFNKLIKKIEVTPGKYRTILDVITILNNKIDTSLFEFKIYNTNRIQIDFKNKDNLIIIFFQKNFNCNFFLNKEQKYVDNSIGPVLGFKPINILSKIPTKLINSYEGTSFLVDNYININYLYKSSKEEISFYDISSNIDSINNKTINFCGKENKKNLIQIEKYTTPYHFNLMPDPYIILHISKFKVNNGLNKPLQDSFAVIPIINYFSCCITDKNDTNQLENFITYSIINRGFSPSKPYIKYFNPPEGKVNELYITFYRPNGDVIDFNGINHLLEFEFENLNQPGIYNQTVLHS